MTDKSAAAEDIAAIEDLIGDLEKRLRRFATTARREGASASSDFGDFVTEALGRIKDRVRESGIGASQSVVGEASRIGSHALKKVADEAGYRPLLMVAVAGGIGYLAGRGRLSR